MSRVRVKICGLTRAEDALAAADAGSDAVGLVFYTDSPRAVTVAQAREISAALPPFVARVALFLEPAAAWVDEVIACVRPDVLQFHGRESAAFCGGFGLPYLKTVPMGDRDADVSVWARDHAGAQGLLLDGNRSGAPGGAGKRFDWAGTLDLGARPIIVAGGLDAHNVARAIRRLRPYAVDVSSGVEYAPGIKSAARMQDFVAAVQTAAAAPSACSASGAVSQKT